MTSMYAKEFDNEALATIHRWVAEARRIVLTAHVNADGDACGSLLGATHLLDGHAKQAKSIVPVLPNGCPENFRWLPGAERIVRGDSQRETVSRLMLEADLLICLDLNSLDRIDPLDEDFRRSTAHKLIVDHHHNPQKENFDVVISDPDISSTCELVHWLGKALWGDNYLTRDIATCLYTGLRTDTGGFAFSCSQPSCFVAAAELVAQDIHPAEINDRITNNFSIKRMKFFAHALSNRMFLYPEQKAAMMLLTKEEMDDMGIVSDDLEGLVNYTLMMREIETGVLLRGEEGRTKVSFRTKGKRDMRLLAEKIGGGGHTKAAGGTCHGTFDEAVRTVQQLLGVSGKGMPLKTLLLTLVMTVGLLVSCVDRTPIIEIDNTPSNPLKENMINANRVVAQSESTQIEAYLQRHSWKVSTLPCGASYMVDKPGNGTPILADEQVAVTYRLEALDGTPFYTRQRDTLTVGRREQTLALDELLQHVDYHAQVRMVAPSACGYGVAGDGDAVGSRTVIVYKINEIERIK